MLTYVKPLACYDDFVKIVITLHVKYKLKEEESKKLGITKKHLINVLNNPVAVDRYKDPHQSVGEFTKDLSLSVIWKIENRAIKMVTFYPSSKGRYENKILRRR